MRRFAVVEKEIGETPLMALEKYRARESLGDVPITYAGRLDPMASGKLLLLIGDECRRRARYDGLDKAYEFEVLFGISSDTGDILGLMERDQRSRAFTIEDMRAAIAPMRGIHVLPYPVYSSKPVDGKPLYMHAIEKGAHAVRTPERAVRIHAIHARDIRMISGADLLQTVEERIQRLRVDANDTNPHKDFRRDDVIARWRKSIEARDSYAIARVSAIVSSGTYIRSLAPLIGERLGTTALAFSIHRSTIGRYIGAFGRGFWAKTYK